MEAKPSADIYSLGKVLVFLLTGQTDVDYVRFPVWRDFIVRFINTDPRQRPTSDKVIEELNQIPT